MTIIQKWAQRLFSNFAPANGGTSAAQEYADKALPRNLRNTVSSAGSFFGFYGQPGFRFQPTPYNPDQLVQRKGLKIYRSMLVDEQIKAALAAKMYAVLSTGYEVQLARLPEDEDAEAAQEHKGFIEFCFEEIKGGIASKLLGIMDALAYGFSVSEKIYTSIDYGPYEGKWMLRDLRTRPPEDIEFQLTAEGDLAENGVLQFLVALPTEKFVLYSYNGKYGNPYGDSDLRAAYRAWWAKDNMLKLELVAMERYAEPIAVATYEGLLDISQRDSIEQFLKNLQSRSGILIPKNVTLDFKAPPPRAGEAFIPVIRQLDDQLRIAVLMPGLMGLSGEQQVGSLARAVKEFDVFLWILGQLRTDLELVVNEQIVKPLVDLNFEVEHGQYPKFKFNAVTEEARQRSFELFLTGLGAGGLQLGPEDQNKLRELIDFEPLPEDFEQIDPTTGLPPGERPPPPEPPGMGFNGGFGGEEEQWGGTEEEDMGEEEEFDYSQEQALIKYVERMRKDYHQPGGHDQESHGGDGNDKQSSLPDSYAGMSNWIAARSSAYGSRNEFLASDEYKKAYQYLAALYEAEKIKTAGVAEKAMSSVNAKFGDRVFYDYVTPFAVEKYSGTIINRGGLPYVRLDEGQATMTGAKSARWHKGWRKQ